MRRDADTYQRVRQQYDQWVQEEAARPPRLRLRRKDPVNFTPPGDSEMSRNIAAIIGIGIGGVLLLLAGVAFATAARWAELARDSATVGYTIVGIFLVIAGLGGIAATWNHNFRVLARSNLIH